MLKQKSSRDEMLLGITGNGHFLDRRVQKWAGAGRRASANFVARARHKRSWDRVPTWEGDRERQWKRSLRDVELYLETDKLDVDVSHGARLLSRLTGSAKELAETFELGHIRRSTGDDKDTRETMIA